MTSPLFPKHGRRMTTPPRPQRPRRAIDLSRYPNVYDAAFCWDRSREAETFVDLATSRLGKAPQTAVELACGTGALARLWASWGLEVYGLDRSRSAISRARASSRNLVSPDHWVVGELRDFRLPQKVDLAAVPLDGLGYLVQERGILSFFRAVRRCLVPGGVLAVDITLHPENAAPLRIRNEWNVVLRPRGSLRVRWQSQGRPWGVPPRQWEVGRIDVHLPNCAGQVFWEARPHSTLSPQALRSLSRKAGGLREMWIYSGSAHRAGPRTLRRTDSKESILGPRLITWQRT